MEPSRAPDLPHDEGGEWTEADVTWLRARRGSGVHRVLTRGELDLVAPTQVPSDAAADEQSTRAPSSVRPPSMPVSSPEGYARWRAHGARVLLGLSHNPYKPR